MGAVSESPDRWIRSALALPSVITSPDLILGSVPVIPMDSQRLVPLAVSLGPRTLNVITGLVPVISIA
jgi:hypothetical protein